MRKLVLSLAFTILAATGTLAASPEQEKTFLDTYKSAFAAGDADALYALLFTDGAIPMAVDFYKMTMTADFGQKAEITLEDLTAEDQAQVAQQIPTPDGGMAVLLPKPVKKLIVKIDTSDANGTSSSTSTVFVGEQDGKLGISMPHPAP